MALAGQALTVADAIGERLTVGIGLSHEPMMVQLGIGFETIRHLREYLSILMLLLLRVTNLMANCSAATYALSNA